MRINFRSLGIAVLGINACIFGLIAPVQGQTANGTTQSTQPQAATTPAPNRPKDPNSATPANPPQPESLADIARKAKLKKQQDQSSSQDPAVKPRVYSEDNFTPAKTASSPSTQPPAQGPPAPSGSKAPDSQPGSVPSAANVDIQTFGLEKSTIKRPGGSQVDWQIHNKSEHLAKLTVTLVVTGPCKYKKEDSRSGEFTPGGYTDNMFSVFFFESDCAGQYLVELRINFGGQLLKSASSTVNVL
jgi:hypothetical protein